MAFTVTEYLTGLVHPAVCCCHTLQLLGVHGDRVLRVRPPLLLGAPGMATHASTSTACLGVGSVTSHSCCLLPMLMRGQARRAQAGQAWFWGFRGSGSQGLRVSGFRASGVQGLGVQGLRGSRSQGFRVLGVQGLRGSGSRGFRVSGVQGLRVQGLRGSGFHTCLDLASADMPPQGLFAPKVNTCTARGGKVGTCVNNNDVK